MISSSKKEFIVEYRPLSIRIARVSSHTDPIVIEAIEEIPLGQGASKVAEAVRKFGGAKSNGYLNGSCVVYPGRRIVRQVSIDSPKGKESQFILDLIQNDFADAPGELSAHCLSASTGEEINPADFNRKEVIACGVPNQDVVDLQNQMLEHGIYPERVELGTIGMIGALQDALIWSGSSAPALLLEVEDRFANAVIIGPKGIEMSRRVETGSADIASALKSELNLKDEEAAYKLLSSNDFDFGSISRKILRRLLRELQSSIGFYEVQTGQSVSWIHCSLRSASMDWFQDSVGSYLNLDSFTLNVPDWLEANKIKLSSEDLEQSMDLGWIGLLSSLCNFKREETAA